MKQTRTCVGFALLAFVLWSAAASATETYGPVKRGEDLWDISRRVYYDRDVSRDQVMLAILAANPGAFSHSCNVNSTLKTGSILRIPDLTVVQSRTKSEAAGIFSRQLREWERARQAGVRVECRAVSHPAQDRAAVVTSAPAAGRPAGASPQAGTLAILDETLVTDERAVEEEPAWAGIVVLIVLIMGITLWKFWHRGAATTPARPAAPPAAQGADFEHMSPAEVLRTLHTDDRHGLAAGEAARRLGESGPNALVETQVGLLRRLQPYFWGPIPWMIEAAAVLSLITRDWNDFIIIMALLFMNALIGFWESHSAANALAALKGQLALKSRALREGRWQGVEAHDLVPGDIIRVRLGDIIPADAMLISGQYLSVDQAALTGESLPVSKQCADVVFSGSVAKQGEMVAVVIRTGAKTFFGRTAQLVESAGAPSHLQQAVVQVGNFLILSAVGLCAILTIVELYWGTPLLGLLKIVLILLVASIPVAMPAVLSVTMALGALVLSRMKAIVSRLEAIEELAGVDILCSDKTGTLTQNKLTLGEVRAVGDWTPDEVLLAAALASKPENNDVIDLAVVSGLRDGSQLDRYQQLQFTPFDPVGKRTEGTIKDESAKSFRVTKGASQVVLALCRPNPETQTWADRLAADFASKGYRTLGVARTDDDGNWQFLGLLSLSDPPREDSAATIAATHEFGIDVKMVTGDSTAIARQIGGQLGIGTNIQSADTLFGEGVSVHHLPPAAARLIESTDGFAQVFPEHKYGIVRALQSRGHIVAMTGDGVNDAPALKQADVGVAVSGATDAARAAADLVLTEPGLSVITAAVQEARRIFERMMSYTIYRVAMSIDIMVFVVLASLVFGFFPLTAVMLVGLALLDDIPIMAIAFDHTQSDPRPTRWSADRVFVVSGTLGVLAVVQSFGLLYAGIHYLRLDAAHLQTLMFLQLVVGGHLMLFVTRCKGAYWRRPFPSWQLFWSLLGTQVFVVFMTAFGWLVPALPWDLIGWVWLYNLVWMFGQDLVKIAIYRAIQVRTTRQVFAGKARTFLKSAREPLTPTPS